MFGPTETSYHDANQKPGMLIFILSCQSPPLYQARIVRRAFDHLAAGIDRHFVGENALWTVNRFDNVHRQADAAEPLTNPPAALAAPDQKISKRGSDLPAKYLSGNIGRT